MPRRLAGSVLRQTFLHVPGVGYRTEERLWQSGLESWDDLRTAKAERVTPHLRLALEEMGEVASKAYSEKEQKI